MSLKHMAFDIDFDDLREHLQEVLDNGIEDAYGNSRIYLKEEEIYWWLEQIDKTIKQLDEASNEQSGL